MASNIEQFSVYAAAVLECLYDDFPLSLDLASSQFVNRPDVTELFATLDERLKTMPDDGTFARAELASREGQKITDAVHGAEARASIFRGTVEFLVAEQFIRSGGTADGIFQDCQLTAKGFAHLHLEFKDKAIVGGSSPIIKWIKNRLANPSAIEGALIVSVISRFLA